MAIADDHWMYLDGVESNPSTASIGQAVTTPDGARLITHIDYRRERGAYHIITPGGSYYVDHMLASTCTLAHGPNPTEPSLEGAPHSALMELFERTSLCRVQTTAGST